LTTGWLPVPSSGWANCPKRTPSSGEVTPRALSSPIFRTEIEENWQECICSVSDEIFVNLELDCLADEPAGLHSKIGFASQSLSGPRHQLC